LKWNYGDAYIRHPIDQGRAVFQDGSILQCHDIFNPIPAFMLQADLIFTDAPWNKGNINSFYTKAGIEPLFGGYDNFYIRLFECIKKIRPKIAYCEIGKEYLPDFVIEMRKQYKYVTFYNSTYYHKLENICYIVRGANKFKKPKLDGMDEENIIEWVCANEDYNCIGDLCMGRGLVAVNAYKNGKKFVGTELNHKRLSVALERICNIGGKYTIEGDQQY